MTNKMKSTAPVSSVGADGEQPKTKICTEIIANGNVKNNLQATVFCGFDTNCPEKSGQGGGLQTVSMTELYDTVYPPRTPVVDGFLYGGTLDLCQYFGHKKLKVYVDFFNSSSSFCCGVL